MVCSYYAAVVVNVHVISIFNTNRTSIESKFMTLLSTKLNILLCIL